ncbi:MAG: HAMP domain-containing histidine kinase [Defluviitaleaceae bacterium]|nr:HAMP domain-containing histidine kinase [Defluviitaleaceae bacterium]
MRIKTFLATYLLFLVVLFSCFGIVSVFMTRSQMDMYMAHSAAEYQRIAGSLSRDLAVLYGISHNIADDINALVTSYMAHYAQSNVYLSLHAMGLNDVVDGIQVAFVHYADAYFIRVVGALPQPFSLLRLDYYFDITQTIAEMRRVQNILLLICTVFAALTAFVLYVILARIFKPLRFVSQASRNIATGNYSERITVHGKNELAAMTEDFNSMADEIERQMQALKDEADGKQQFVDNFAHEMRTPLTSILGYAQYLQSATLGEGELIESAGYIIDEAHHLRNIANSLLTLATLRGHTAVAGVLSIPQLFDDIRHSLEPSLAAQNIRLICDIQADTLHGQADLIKSLLMNLCTNARNACPSDGSGVITLSAKNIAGVSFSLSISDNGHGIPVESLSKLTEPFYRVDPARNREHGGTGLGLALCARIAEAHGATLVIESTVNSGTTATVTFTTPLQVDNHSIT